MANRLLTINLQTKYYGESVPRRNINYSGDSIDLTETEYSELLSELPSFWHTEKDRLLRFIFFDDKTYFCEREKEVFNYTNRDTEIKIYKFDYATQEQANFLYAFFLEKYTKIKVARVDNAYDEIMSKIKDMSFVKISLLNARDEMLRNSDYLMMADYPIDEEKRNAWATYRQELRDITEQEAWINNDIINIVMPVSPEPVGQFEIINSYLGDKNQIPENLTREMLENLIDKPIDQLIKMSTEISLKFEILRSLSKMKLPMIDINYENIVASNNEISDYMNEIMYDGFIENTLPKSWWDAAVTNLEQKIQDINEKLSSYNLDFTINDVINAVIEQNKLSEQEIEVNTIIEEL